MDVVDMLSSGIVYSALHCLLVIDVSFSFPIILWGCIAVVESKMERAGVASTAEKLKLVAIRSVITLLPLAMVSHDMVTL